MINPPHDDLHFGQYDDFIASGYPLGAGDVWACSRCGAEQRIANHDDSHCMYLSLGVHQRKYCPSCMERIYEEIIKWFDSV